MDDRNVREGINDEESNVVSRERFIKYHLMDVYSTLATYGLNWTLTKGKSSFEFSLSKFSLQRNHSLVSYLIITMYALIFPCC